MAHGSGRSEGRHTSGQGQRGGATVVSPAAVERYLRGVSYPASKRDLVQKARGNGAPQDVMNVLNRIDDREYASPVDVTKAVGKIE